jgi:hypothetical protein
LSRRYCFVCFYALTINCRQSPQMTLIDFVALTLLWHTGHMYLRLCPLVPVGTLIPLLAA